MGSDTARGLKRGLAVALLLGAGGALAFRWATAPQAFAPRPATRVAMVAEALRRGDFARAAVSVDALGRDETMPLAERYAARLRLRLMLDQAHFDQTYEGGLSIPGMPEFLAMPGESVAETPAPPAACPATPAEFGAPFTYLRPAAPAPGFVELLDDLFALTGRHPRVVSDATIPAGARRVAVAAGVVPAVAPPAEAGVVWLAPSEAASAHLGLPPPVPLTESACRLVTRDARLGALARFEVDVPIAGPVAQLGAVPPERVLATLVCAGGTYPGVVAGGAAGNPSAVFAFDALATVATLRQGDPAQAGRENDDIGGLRPADLFVPARTRAEMMVPRADLLADAIVRLVEGPAPTVRLWPHPAGATGALIITSDQDFAGQPQMMAMMAALRAARIPATFFLTSVGPGESGALEPISPSAEVLTLARTWGFDFAAHTYVSPGTAEAPAADPPAVLRAHADALKKVYGIEPQLVRQHEVSWSGYVDRAQVLASVGYRWNADYLTVVGRTFPTLGYMTGSGRALRLYDAEGRPLPIRQVATQLDDHADPAVLFGPRTMQGRLVKLSAAAFLGDTLQLVAENGRHFHGALVLNNHPVFFTRTPDWLMRTVEAARESGQAVMSLGGYVQRQEALAAAQVATRADARGVHVCSTLDDQELRLVDAPAGPVRLDGAEVEPRLVFREGAPARVVTVGRGAHVVEFGGAVP